MVLWLAIALMTATALIAIVLPFVFGNQAAAGGSDMIVNKDQLAEIDRDLSAGHIGAADAGPARAEVSRRLLQAAEVNASRLRIPAEREPSTARRLAVLVAALALLPAMAAGVYLRLGSPATATSEKLSESIASSSDDDLVDAMVAQVEGYLKEAPNDGHGWEALAPVYFRLGRYEDSARAWKKAIAILGDSADREENLGESLVAMADGTVTNDAKRAFAQALSMDHENVAARFYTGLAAKQEGRPNEAAKIWNDLRASASLDADWANTVRDALARLNEPGGATNDNPSSAETLSAATTNRVVPSATAPPEHDNASMQAMVDKLADRLQSVGGDLDSWLMLVRSYQALGQTDKALAAITQARAAFASDRQQLSLLDQILRNSDGAQKAISAPRKQEAQAPAIADASAEQQMEMIKGMVDGLAERLRRDGGKVEDWIRLMRSYVVLDRRDEASAAQRNARTAFANDTEALRRLDATAGELGIGDQTSPNSAKQ